MIPIYFKNGAINRLYHLLLNVKPKQKNKAEYIKNIREINKWCLENISVSGKKYSFEDVGCGQFLDLMSKDVRRKK